jgi:citrate/tricarballylate utilization protein
MQICNACRYCEGFCAVFPSMEKRFDFTSGDLNYLANLCHDCRECYYSCQYSPPHEFQINVPKVFAGIRQQTYKDYAWPGIMIRLFSDSTRALLISAIIIPLIFVMGLLLLAGPGATFTAYSDAEGSFYRLVSHSMMVWGFGTVAVFVILAMFIGWLRFRADISTVNERKLDLRTLGRALHDAMKLRYLGGADGGGCAYPDERASNLRRRFHHLSFYGFMLCFAATSTATIYHYGLGLYAPYPIFSLPVMFGLIGGIFLLIGPAGLFWLKRIRDVEPADPTQTSMDISFLVLLFSTSLTGLLLLFLRETAWMGIILVIHLGLVMGLFLTMPYGKFVHGIYRFGALVKYAKEEGV